MSKPEVHTTEVAQDVAEGVGGGLMVLLYSRGFISDNKGGGLVKEVTFEDTVMGIVRILRQ